MFADSREELYHLFEAYQRLKMKNGDIDPADRYVAALGHMARKFRANKLLAYLPQNSQVVESNERGRDTGYKGRFHVSLALEKVVAS